MGEILKSEVKKDGKVLLTLSLAYDEFLNLKGHFKHVHLFSEDLIEEPINLSVRGRNGATKYFVIPKKLRGDLKFKTKANCQKQVIGNHVFFIYSLDEISF